MLDIIESWRAGSLLMFALLRTAADCLLIPGHQSPSSILPRSPLRNNSNVLYNYNKYTVLGASICIFKQVVTTLDIKNIFIPCDTWFYFIHIISNNSQFVNQLKVLNVKSKVLLNITNYKTNRYMSKCQQVNLSLADKDAYFPLV